MFEICILHVSVKEGRQLQAQTKYYGANIDRPARKTIDHFWAQYINRIYRNNDRIGTTIDHIHTARSVLCLAQRSY